MDHQNTHCPEYAAFEPYAQGDASHSALLSNGHRPTALTVSPAFGPGQMVGGALPDVIIMTADGVQFHAHSDCILQASANSFGGLLIPPLDAMSVAEIGEVLNVVLHVMYEKPCFMYDPSLATIEAALEALVKYGAPLVELAAPPLPLYTLLVAHAPRHPIKMYALAGHHGLDQVAVAVSAFLLAYAPSQLSKELALKMGPVYLRRFWFLHQTRLSALKTILLRPPGTHAATASCDSATQGELKKAWTLATAQLVWDATPEISTSGLRCVLEKVSKGIACVECRVNLQARIEETVQEWSGVQRTI